MYLVYILFIKFSKFPLRTNDMRMQTFFLTESLKILVPKCSSFCQNCTYLNGISNVGNYMIGLPIQRIPIYQNTTKYRSIVVVPSRIADNR